MKSTVLLVLAIATIAAANPFRGVITLKDLSDVKCDGPECPGGCCPEADYVCCESGYFCAASQADCPDIPMVKVQEEKEVEQDCEGTVCPGGCCPNAGWFCCPGDEYCAASEEYCKKKTAVEKLISMAA